MMNLLTANKAGSQIISNSWLGSFIHSHNVQLVDYQKGQDEDEDDNGDDHDDDHDNDYDGDDYFASSSQCTA